MRASRGDREGLMVLGMIYGERAGRRNWVERGM